MGIREYVKSAIDIRGVPDDAGKVMSSGGAGR